jgi:hypothetical protein
LKDNVRLLEMGGFDTPLDKHSGLLNHRS